MNQEYFRGFDFYDFYPKKSMSSQGSSDRLQADEEVDGLDAGISTPLWTEDGIRKEFFQTLKRLNKIVPEHRLTMARRSIVFVTPEEMVPRTKEDIQLHQDRYGVGYQYLNDADVYQTPWGTFKIRIGYKGRELDSCKESVLEAMFHEYGHTISGIKDDEVHEELKACAFEMFSMKNFLNQKVAVVRYPNKVENIHERALFKLGQLTYRGVCPEAIIAHIIERPFAGYGSYDYLKLMNNQGNSRA